MRLTTLTAGLLLAAGLVHGQSSDLPGGLYAPLYGTDPSDPSVFTRLGLRRDEC